MKSILGIDLGTSSVKLLLRHADGRCEKARESYESRDAAGWWEALCRAAKRLDLQNICAVGLSSQVGTYIVGEGQIIDWSSPAGFTELRELKTAFSQSFFIREISMPHPDIISYPIPRLMHILRQTPGVSSVCMPKDLLIEKLTGRRVSDVYSWRGLANLEMGRYSRFFLDWLKLDARALPPLLQPTDCAGEVSAAAAEETGIPSGARVYTGCNDFFAALAGSGICAECDLFDVTGTSEHIGGIASSILPDAPPVTGRYFEGFVRYGVTGSSGASLDFGRRICPEPIDISGCLSEKPPVFLPYLNGERCPVCDPDARGVFFGMDGGCSREMMAYSVMEGVAFNLRQIMESLDLSGSRIVVSGGAAQNDTLNQIKANVLGMTVAALDEPDASAQGAMMIAGVGEGVFGSLKEAFEACGNTLREFVPDGRYDYRQRFEFFKRLYPLLKEQFVQWRGVE